MDKYKIIALFGKSGAGKDTIQKWLVENGYGHGIVSCTTRPKRDYEINGKDYYFISEADFLAKIIDGEMLEATFFKGWAYGTSLKSLSKEKINIGVFNPEGIENLCGHPEIEILPIYVTASDKTRLLRCLNREVSPDCSEICRRFLVDAKDFTAENLPFKYILYPNEINLEQEFHGLLNNELVKEFINS